MTGFFSFLQRQILPLGLLTVAVIGVLFPQSGRFAASSSIPQYIAVNIIFVCSGLLLRTDEIYAALSAWRASIFGTVSILFATPLIGVSLAFRVPVDPTLQLGLSSVLSLIAMPMTLNPSSSYLILEREEGRHFLPTKATPCSPEVHDQDLSLKIGEFDFTTTWPRACLMLAKLHAPPPSEEAATQVDLNMAAHSRSRARQ